MNDFIKAAEELVYLNGVTCTYVAVTEGTYDSDLGTVSNTEIQTVIKAYPKDVKTSNYYLPNLVGKSVVEFIVVSKDLASYPAPTDKIIKGSTVYSVDSVKDVVTEGVSTIYKIIAVKG